MQKIGQLAAMCGLVVALVCGAALAKEINVPADFKTIGDALANAAAGDVIKVAAGTYTENLNVSVGVTLEGAGADKTIIDGSNGRPQQQPVILIRGTNNVTIRGFTIQNGRRGVSTERATGIVVENNVITKNLRQGVLFNTKSEGKILNNQIVENVPDADGTLGRGINVTDSQAEMVGNTVARNAEIGVAVFFSKVTVRGNKIQDNARQGLHLQNNPDTSDSSEGTVSENTITGNTGFGIVVVGNNTFEITKNTIADNKAAANPNQGDGTGVLLQDGASVKLAENTITGNASNGIGIGSGSTAEINSNTIKDNKGCGVSAENGTTVTGSNNEMSGNGGGDVCGSAPASLKKP